MLRATITSLIMTAGLAQAVTFHKDVVPVLQRNCQGCHRAGEAAPMAFTSYEQVRPWAKAIKASVLAKKMPPWFADPAYGKFHNERTLKPEEIQTIVAWVDGGAVEGNVKDAPPPVQFVDGWNIGKPDLVVEMPKAYEVPSNGTIEYTYVIVPLGLKEDTWVQAAEVRPGSRAVVHHVIAFLREPESKWMRDYPVGEAFVPKKGNRSSRNEASEAGAPGSELLVGYAPGLPPWSYTDGKAKLVKAGTDVVFQLHYTANGKVATDKTKVGLVFAKGPVSERVMTMAATNARFVIPPGAPAHEVKSQFTTQADIKLLGLMPHMHLRGKDFHYQAVYPTGEKETLLNVPRYDFNWQLFYYLKDSKDLPKGTRIECTAHFDNSSNNAANPDASKEVRWGDQSWEEMMIGWFDVAFDAKMNPVKIFRAEKPASASGTEE